MNNLKFLRLVCKPRILYGSYDKYPGLQKLLNRSSSTSGSISQIVKDKEVFHDALPGILDNLQASPKISQLPELSTWIRKVLESNLRGGKCARGLITMFAYEMLEKPENQTEEKLKQSRVLGWCLEMLQAYFMIADDIMDGSTTRRGSPCWYRVPNVGLGAINDFILIQGAIMETVEIYFGKTKHYVDIVRLFNEAILYTSMGQHLDHTTAQHKKHDYSLYTIDRYESIIQYKTSHYTFRLPVLLALALVQNVDKQMYDDIDDISSKLGRLYQMQDDYLDCYGDESTTGKAGTDIQEGKCCWLAVTALQHCNDSQKALFSKYYGSKEPEHIAYIKQLYDELKVPELYRQKETEVYNDTVQRIKMLPSETAPNYFFELLNTLYKRKQ